MKCLSFISWFLAISIMMGCTSNDKHEHKKFRLLSPQKSGIYFSNELPYTESFNTYTYRNFYNGGGVAVGDINNDGLDDLFFTGNIDDNKLYLNKGNLTFKDVTDQAGVASSGVWSTGATMIDINADGLLDIYVCKAGPPEGEKRHNELFINQGNLTFIEASETYGLNLTGLSIHAAFFDYDKDGDLDCYILSNSLRSVGGFDLKPGQREVPDPEGNKLLRNDDGFFVDVTQSAGIYYSKIGYGLGITLSDFNLDSWPDIFISNDFFERDYLYINQKDGSFKEVGDQSFQSMSMGSMGADASDINNDLLPDLFVTEMLPASLERQKTKAQFETWNKYAANLNSGYHHQFSRNVLQRNFGNLSFKEIGRFSGVAATEWSWASIIQDFDNDGLKDLFVSNGIYKDLLDKDYLNYFANDALIKQKLSNREEVLKPLIDSMPSKPVANFIFQNEGNFKFKDISEAWGINQPSFSNGSAYSDLDLDGDLDLITNNVNMPAFIYENRTDTSTNHFLQIKLEGDRLNRQAIGAKVIIKSGDHQSYLENFTARGFQSTVSSILHFGLGDHTMIDSIIVVWPDDQQTIKTNIKANQRLTIIKDENNAAQSIQLNRFNTFIAACQHNEFKFKHQEISSNLFSRERLLIQMDGFDGPTMASADFNGDGMDDLFVGGGKNQVSQLYLSNNDKYQENIQDVFIEDQKSETTSCIAADIDLDGDIDLYVSHGGKTYSNYSTDLDDVLYLNRGDGNFTRKSLDFSDHFYTGDVEIIKWNNDSLPDILITEKMKTNYYGLPGNLYVLINKGNGDFILEIPDHFKNIGMITSCGYGDINADGISDLVIAGLWHPIKYLEGHKGGLVQSAKWKIIPESQGLWHTIHLFDIDQDGNMDIIAGNEGENTFLDTLNHLFIQDFDQNGSQEQMLCREIDKQYYPVHNLDEIYAQVPLTKKKYLYYADLAKASLSDLFDQSLIEKAIHLSLDVTQSGIFYNTNGAFTFNPLPPEWQYAPIYALYADINDQNQVQLIGGGNAFQFKPQFGRQDASSGWISLTDGSKGHITGVNALEIGGAMRSIVKMGEKYIFGMNNDYLKSCTIHE